MSSKYTVIASLVIFTLCSTKAHSDAFTVACDGNFHRGASHASLVKAFGQNNTSYQRVQIDEGEKQMATILFPKDAAKRLEIDWNDPKERRDPYIRIGGRSSWVTANGVHLGSTLQEVEEMNGKPFQLAGFDWDYGGRATAFEGGKLSEPMPGGCLLSLDFAPSRSTPAKLLAKVSGSRSFSSSNRDMQVVSPKVVGIMIYYKK